MQCHHVVSDCPKLNEVVAGQLIPSPYIVVSTPQKSWFSRAFIYIYTYIYTYWGPFKECFERGMGLGRDVSHAAGP